MKILTTAAFLLLFVAITSHAQETNNKPALNSASPGATPTVAKQLGAAEKDVLGFQKAVAERLAELTAASAEMKKGLAVFDPKDPASGQVTAEAFRRAVTKHVGVADFLIKEKPTFDAAFDRFLASVEATPEAYRRLGDAYAGKGKQLAKEKGEAADFFSAQYFQWSKRCYEIADTFKNQAKELVKTHEKLGDKLQFVAKSREFLTDLLAFVQIWENAVRNQADIQAYTRLLDRYIAHVKSTIEDLDKFSQVIQAPSLAPSDPKVSPVPVSGQPQGNQGAPAPAPKAPASKASAASAQPNPPAIGGPTKSVATRLWTVVRAGKSAAVVDAGTKDGLSVGTQLKVLRPSGAQVATTTVTFVTATCACVDFVESMQEGDRVELA